MMACTDARSHAAAVLARHVEALPRHLAARLLTADDIDRLVALRGAVLSALDHPDHYRPENEPEGFVADHLERLGLSIGLFQGDCLLAYGALGLPGPRDKNLGRSAGLPLQEIPLAAHLASAMVRPGVRGRNLHRWLTALRIDIAAALGRRHVFSTISPLNHASWGNLAAFAVYPTLFLAPPAPGAVPRLLLHRDLHRPLRMDPASARLIPVAEIHRDDSLFDGGAKLWASVKLPDAAFAVAGRPCP